MLEVNIETTKDKHAVWCKDYQLSTINNICTLEFQEGYILEPFKRAVITIAHFPLHNLVSIIETEINNE